MAKINHTENFSSIQIKDQIYFVFGNLEDGRTTVEKIKHAIDGFRNFFKTINEEPPKVLMNWRDGHKGDWVMSDDYRVIQILNRKDKKRDSLNKAIIRTCVGTFTQHPDTIFDTDFELHPDRYRISNTKQEYFERLQNRENLSVNEKIFCKKVAMGVKPTDAYMETNRTNNKRYASTMSNSLLKQERITSEISEEVERILEEEGVSKRYIIQKYKELIDDGLLDMKNCSGSVRAALKDLSDISGLSPSKNKKTSESKGVFEEIESDYLDKIEEAEYKALEKTTETDEQLSRSDFIDDNYNENQLEEVGNKLLQ